MWEKDSQLDDEKLDHDSLAIPKLHAKYLRLYNNFVTLRDQAELDVKSVPTVTGGSTTQVNRKNLSTLNFSKQMYPYIWKASMKNILKSVLKLTVL